MMKGMEGLIYEERLKNQKNPHKTKNPKKTQSQGPEMTSGNMITDSKNLKGGIH